MNSKPSKKSKALTQPVVTPGHQRSVFQSWSFVIGVTLVGAVLVVAGLSQLGREATDDEIAFEVVADYPHDPLAFSQGLVFHEGKLYESTGRYGESSLREVEIATGNVLRQVDVSPDLFGEGLCLWGNEWRQLTWQGQVVLHYDKDSLEETRRTTWSRQGWGLAQDGRQLIISDGTSRLFFVDPSTNEVLRSVDVNAAGERVDRINELEYVDGFIYANVWYKPYLLKIEPKSGRVVGRIDLRPQINQMGLRDPDAVCNGIAYNPQSKTFFVTGKLWPKVFEIRLTSR